MVSGDAQLLGLELGAKWSIAEALESRTCVFELRSMACSRHQWRARTCLRDECRLFLKHLDQSVEPLPGLGGDLDAILARTLRSKIDLVEDADGRLGPECHRRLQARRPSLHKPQPQIRPPPPR